MKPSQIDSIYYAIYTFLKSFYSTKIMLILLGSDETPTLVSEFAKIYSLRTSKDKNNVSQYRRYSKWLCCRNKLIEGFTKHNGNYYMVADRRFYHCYSRYGFCTACGILRCSPVWCICGHNNYPMDGLATISNSMSLLRNFNYKQTHQIMPIWNGFHLIVLAIRVMDMHT